MLGKYPILRKKILYTLLMLLIFRLGSFIPVPGLTADAIGQMMGGFAEGMQGLINNFSGGALERGSIFAMSITPYINSSIIIQLLTVAIPALEKLQKEGEEGRKKISQYTRYGAVILGFIQASGLYIGLTGQHHWRCFCDELHHHRADLHGWYCISDVARGRKLRIRESATVFRC